VCRGPASTAQRGFSRFPRHAGQSRRREENGIGSRRGMRNGPSANDFCVSMHARRPPATTSLRGGATGVRSVFDAGLLPHPPAEHRTFDSVFPSLEKVRELAAAARVVSPASGVVPSRAPSAHSATSLRAKHLKFHARGCWIRADRAPRVTCFMRVRIPHGPGNCREERQTR